MVGTIHGCKRHWPGASFKFVGGICLLILVASADAQQLVDNPIIRTNFTGISEIASGVGNVTQMTFGPDGRLYMATHTGGIKRYDYDPDGGLSNGVTVWSRAINPQNPDHFGQLNGSIGIAFHEDAVLGTVMYIAPSVTGNFDPTMNITQSILRLTDNNGDGLWGERRDGEVNQAIVDNLRVTDLHQVNQMLVEGDKLYVGIGSRTRTGGDRSEYDGSPNPDDGEFAYTGSVNWIRDLTQLSGDTTTPNLAGFDITNHHTETRPFTSTDTGKLTVYSTGFRNDYGIALDGNGQLWATMNENENPVRPDELHRSNFQDDHGFPKENEVSGDWKQNQTAIDAGFFQSFKEPVALLGDQASANGLSFTDINDEFADHAFIVRFHRRDLVAIDTDSGEMLPVATNIGPMLDVLTDPQGNLLLGGLNGRVYRVSLVEGAGVMFGDLNGDHEIDAADWTILRDNFNANLAGLPSAEAYALGDLNGDFANDALDFTLFKETYEEAHGNGAFSELAHVPEPATWAIAASAALMFLTRRGSRRSATPSSFYSTSNFS